MDGDNERYGYDHQWLFWGSASVVGTYVISFIRSFKLLDHDRATEIQQRSEKLKELEDHFASARMRRTVTDQMAEVFKEGKRIQKLGEIGTGTARQWAIDTQNLINHLFGAAEGGIFSSDAGFPVAISSFEGDVWMQRRLTRLHDLHSKADRLLRDNPVDLKSLQRSQDAHGTVSQA